MGSLDEVIRKFISKENLEKIVSGLPVEFKEIKNKEQAVVAGLHCCLNGPVSVHKVTQFPIIGEASIDTLVGKRITNRAWKGFCDIIAHALIDNGVNILCNSMTLLKTYWPLKDWPIKKL
jgi:hypothetical protein